LFLFILKQKQSRRYKSYCNKDFIDSSKIKMKENKKIKYAPKITKKLYEVHIVRSICIIKMKDERK
jgi:hypothetical protein